MEISLSYFTLNISGKKWILGVLWYADFSYVLAIWILDNNRLKSNFKFSVHWSHSYCVTNLCCIKYSTVPFRIQSCFKLNCCVYTCSTDQSSTSAGKSKMTVPLTAFCYVIVCNNTLHLIAITLTWIPESLLWLTCGIKS